MRSNHPETGSGPQPVKDPMDAACYFAVEYVFVSGTYHLPVRPAHREYLAALAEVGTLVLSGPLVRDTGGLLIFRARSEAEVWELVDRDPYSGADVLSRVRVERWNPVLGYLVQHLHS